MDDVNKRLLPRTTPPTSRILDEVDEAQYLKEVLHLADGQTEDALESALESEAAASGVQMASHGMMGGWDSTLCEAIIASAAKHSRYGSDGSRSSVSSHLTSPRSSDDKTLDSVIDQVSVHRDSVSFSEYDRFLSKSNASAMHIPLSRNSSTFTFSRISSERSSRATTPPRKSSRSFRHGLRNLSICMTKTKSRDR